MPTNDPKPTKTERRDAARAKAAELREAQRKAEQRRRGYLISAAVAILAVVAIVVVVIIGKSNNPPLDGVAAPAGASANGGIVVGPDGVAGAAIPDGTVVVDIYTDYMCPYCSVFEQTEGSVLDELGKAGNVTVVYHPLAFLDDYSNGTKFSTRAAQAAAVVADAAPEKFAAFHEALFANQPEENSDGLSDADIATIATTAGVPADVVATFGDGRFTEWAAAATEQASKDGVSATPTIKIDGVLFNGDWRVDGELKKYIDAAVAATATGSPSPSPAAS